MSQLAVSLVGLVASALDGRSPGPVKSSGSAPVKGRSVSELVVSHIDPAQRSKAGSDLLQAFYKGLRGG
jgi:hypothetical protein